MSKLSELTEKIANSFSKKSDSKEPPLEPIKEQSDQSLDEIKLVAFIKEKVDQVRLTNSRNVLENIYLTNTAYLMGFDGIYYDSTYRQFKNTDSKRRINRNRFKVNKILPSVQNRLARLTQSPPRYDVRPNSNSTQDKDCARLAITVIENVFDKQMFDVKRQEVIMSAMQGGIAYLQVSWDPSLGAPMIDPETNKLEGYDGDVRIEVLNCLEVFPDPLAKNLEDAGYIIKAKVRKLDYFKMRYPERGGAVKEESTWLMSSLNDLKTNGLTAVGIQGTSTQEQMKNSAIEIIYYEKRSKDYPNGRMIVIANGILLENKELPIGQYDIVKFDDIMIAGRFNSESVITHLRPIQDQYNITRTKCADWIRKMLAGKYIAARGHGMGQEALNDTSGEVVEYNPVPNAAPPTQMQIPVIPSYVYKDLETMDSEFDYISGINEISRGVLPSASIPAAGMAFLQEQDQTRIGVQTTRNELAFAKVGSCVLKYVGKYYKMNRLLKNAGDGLEYTVKDFVGADLNDNYDVIVIEGSTIPSSKVLRRQDLLNVYQLGLLGNPQDPMVQGKMLKLMEYGDVAEVWKTQSLDLAQVKNVIKAIEDGEQMKLVGLMNEFDNHQLHLSEMNDYRKSDKFKELDDKRQKLFMWVMEWRIQAQINIQNPQLAQQTMQAQQMVDVMHEQIAKTGGLQGSPGNATGNPQLNNQGQVVAPPQAEVPVPNSTPVPNSIVQNAQAQTQSINNQ